MKRISVEELTFLRIYKGIQRRFLAIPHKLTWQFSYESLRNRKRLKSFKNLYKGERCYLVANGPSLNKMDLNFLNDKISFGLNRIYLGYDKFNFKNTYLVSINDLVLLQFHEEIKKLDLIKFIKWDNRKLFANDNKTFFIYKSIFGPSFGYDISRSLNPAATVTYAALQIIYYMGFSEVIIIGLDHNFGSEVKAPNYTEIVKTEIDKNHFHPNYFPKGYKWDTPDLKSSEYYYSLANKVYKKNNRKIIDCTIGGKCNIFKKGNIKDYI